MNKFLKFLFTGFIVVLTTLSTFASVTLVVSDALVPPSSIGTVDASVVDFTDITKMQYSLNWDPTELEFIGIPEINMDILGLTDANIDISDAANGNLVFLWEDPNGMGMTVDDGMKLFSMEFRALVPEGGLAEINFGNTPSEIIINRNVSGDSNIYEPDNFPPQKGIISATTAIPDVFFEFNLEEPKDLFCKGDQFCYDITVRDFTDLGIVQVYYEWDTTVINFTGAKNFNGIKESEHFNVTLLDTVNQKYNNISALVYIDINELTPITLPDGANLLTMCFEVVGEPNSSTVIKQIDTKSNDTQIFDKDFLDELDPIQVNTPEITVSDCQSIISFTTECQNIKSEETVCIDFTTTNFQDITDVKYTVTYDPTLLEFVQTENYNLNGLSAANFSDNNGVLTFDWSSPTGENVADGDFLFAACFKAIGPIDTVTQLSYLNLVGNGFNVTNGAGENLEPQFTSCDIEILPPTVTITASTETYPPGEEFCIPITVANFLNITHLEMPIEWDPAVLEYVSINTVDLTGLTSTDFGLRDIATGKLQLNTWDSPTSEGLTLPDGTTIFEVCFKVIGELGTETAIDLPTVADNPAFVINSSDKRPDVATVNGQITVAAGGLVLESIPTEVLEDESFCVDITTRNFNNILSLDYAHIFDPTVLRLDSVVIQGDQAILQQEDFNAMEEDQVKVAWISADPLAGNTLANGTVLYSLCFTAKAALGRCSNFTLDETQEVTTVESAGENIGIFNNLGELCVDNFGLIVSDSIPTKCGSSEGALTLNVSGDPGEQFFYFVTKDGQSFISNKDVEDGQIILTDLAEGVYSIKLTSTTDLTKTITREYDLSLDDGDLPMIDLGDDIDAGCIEQGTPVDLTLDGSSYTLPATGGGVITTSWAISGSEGVIEGDTTKDMVNVTSTGTYIFTVLINTTNCSASDTISVLRTQPPRVQVVKGGTLGCTNSTVKLGVEIFNPEENPNTTFSWSTEDGNIVNENTLIDPVVDQEGLYKFTVIDTLNNCRVSDSTFIIEDRLAPNAEAGEDQELGCEDDFLILQGTGDSGAEVEWSTPDGSSIFYPNQAALNIAAITRVGSYIFTVTNQINGCSTSDTLMVIADESLLVARTNDLVIIGCDTAAVMLDGSNSSQGEIFSYRWEDPNNELISTESITTTETPGDYLLIVTNIDNADCISDSVTVVVQEDKAIPQVSIPNSLSLGCMTECLPLAAVVPEGDNYTYEWTTEDGVLCGGQDSSTAMISAIGVYRLMVTNTDNNCVSTTPSIVGGDGTQIFAETGPDRLIDCVNDVVTLDGRGSDTGSPTLVFSWENEAGQVISAETTAEVSEPYEYTLNVVDTETGCNAIGKVSVTIDQETPTAIAGDAPEITGCNFPTGRRLNGNDSDRGDNITYAWTSTSGNLVGDTTIAAPEISGPGRFVLTVTNTINGCSSTDEVLVQSDVIIPIANAGEDQEINCDQPEVVLAGLNETLPEGSVISWTTTDGNITGETDQLSVSVDAAGYLLTIVSPDGCSASDEVLVDASNLDLPDASAGQERSITCNEPLVINGTGTMGSNIMIEWTTIGGNIVSGGNTYTPEVDRGGSYTLTVTNTETNCKNTSLVLIIDEGNLPVANAGEDQEICINETTLMAELPTGFNGSWSTLEQSMVVSPNDVNTSVADLEEGANTYLWTLSSDECGAFSTDTVVVNIPTLPIANDDEFQIQPDQSFSALDLTENDQINSENFTVNILEQPTTGTLSEVSDGVFEFTTPARYFGTQQFQYEVCNATCSNLCAITNVRIVVLPGADVDTTNTVPNAITPNGDGMNDMLLVDELIFDAVDFPKSEMVIFNRWGDVVYRASPYNNDWQGQSNNGDELPEGTYYYVLRLDISEGEVMKGDITILR